MELLGAGGALEYCTAVGIDKGELRMDNLGEVRNLNNQKLELNNPWVTNETDFREGVHKNAENWSIIHQKGHPEEKKDHKHERYAGPGYKYNKHEIGNMLADRIANQSHHKGEPIEIVQPRSYPTIKVRGEIITGKLKDRISENLKKHRYCPGDTPGHRTDHQLQKRITNKM